MSDDKNIIRCDICDAFTGINGLNTHIEGLEWVKGTFEYKGEPMSKISKYSSNLCLRCFNIKRGVEE